MVVTSESECVSHSVDSCVSVTYTAMVVTSESECVSHSDSYVSVQS